MKKYFLSILGAGLLLTSCQNDDLVMPGTGEEVQATFTISVPDAMGTRAGEVNSAQGGFTNGAGQLNYTVALLRAEDDVVMWSSNTPDAVDGKSATFSPTVVLGYTYEIVAYATFDNAVAAPEVGFEIPADSGLGAISTIEGINDESEDAYFCNATILGEANMAATLKRPFGKLRLVAEDYNKIHALGLEVAKVKVTYGDAVVMENQFDASTKAFEGTATSKVFEFAGETAYSAEAGKDNDGIYTVFVDYLPAGETGETMYPFTIEVTYANDKGTYTRTFTQDIPVKRNHLTTLRGNFFTTEAALTLTVDEMFDNVEENGASVKWDGSIKAVAPKNNVYTITSGSELAWIAQQVNNGETFAGCTVVLINDIDLDNKEWTPIGNSTYSFKGKFDGFGNTIKNLYIPSTFTRAQGDLGKESNIGLFGFTTNGEIKNLTVENAKVSGRLNVGVIAGTPYTSKYTNITVKGHVEVNGMSYVGGVGGKNAYANWTNITVDVDDTSYVYANSIENGTAYRTYVGGVCGFNGEGGHSFTNIKSNINVKGTTCDVGGLFGIAHYGNKFRNCSSSGNVEITEAEEAEEAQEIGGIAGVWNNGGADVEMTNCSFTGTLKTNINVAYYYGGLVGKPYSENGTGKLVIDGQDMTNSIQFVVDTADELIEALEKGGDVVLTSDVKIDPAGMSNAYGTTGINVKNGQTIDGGGHTLDIKGAGGTWDSGINTTGGLIKNLTITGSFRGIFINHNSDHSEKVVLENVKIEGTTYTISCDQGLYQGIEATNCTFNGWTSFAETAGEAKFVNCSFGEGNGYKYCRPYSDTEFVKCTFCKDYRVDTTRATVTFTDCTWEE